MSWAINDQFLGYENKRDKSKLRPGILVDGSKNVVSTDGEIITIRQGYTLVGAADSSLTEIEANVEWQTSSGTERALRSYDDNLEVLIGTTWVEIFTDTAWTDVGFKFAAGYWDTTEEQDALLFVVGDSYIYYWSGGLTTLSTAVDDSVNSIGITAAGTGYTANDVVTITTGDGNATVTIDTVGGSGEVTGITLKNAGSGYSIASGQATSSGTGSGLTINITSLQNGIVKEGTTSWAEERFLTAGSTGVNIKDTGGTWREFIYTGGESTQTLTGVTPDPTSYTFTPGTNVLQKVRRTTNTPTSSLDNDLISLLDNRVYVASLTSNQVYVSEVSDYTNYTAGTSVGDPQLLTLDGPVVAFKPQDSVMYISAGKSYWYQVVSELSSDLLNESLVITLLKNGTDQGALSQDAVESFKGNIGFITNEPTFDFFGRLENFDTPQSKVLSDSIKVDFDYYDFTGATVKYYKNNLYITVPQHSVMLIYNISRGFWEAPWTMPAGRLAIINNNLCIHSNVVAETYKLFDGYNDNGGAIEAIARFSYEHYKERAKMKRIQEFYTEGYIQSNTELTRKIYFDYRGVGGIKNKTIQGTSDKILTLPGPGGIGKTSLGKEKLAGSSEQDDLRKFRIIHEEDPINFYEMAVEYTSNGIDQRWSVLAYGPDVELSNYTNSDIKE